MKSELNSTCLKEFSFASKHGLKKVIEAMEVEEKTNENRKALLKRVIPKILADIFLPKNSNGDSIPTNFILIVHERTGFDTKHPSDGIYHERGIYPAMLQKELLRSKCIKYIASPPCWEQGTTDFVKNIGGILSERGKTFYSDYKSVEHTGAGAFNSKFHFWFLEFFDRPHPTHGNGNSIKPAPVRV